MVALASHSDTKKYWNWNDNFCGKRKRCIAVEASQQPKLRRLSVLSCKVWIAPLAILTLWSVGHTTLRADSLTSVVGKKKLFPQASSRAFRLSLCSWTLLTTTTHTRPKRRRRRRRRRFQKVKNRVCICEQVRVGVCVCVKCECVCVLHSVIHCEFVPDLERRVQRGNKRPSVL